MRATFISHVDKSTKIQETSGTVRVDVKIQLQENLAIFIFYVRSCQGVGADHLHAVAARFVCSSIKAAVSIAWSMIGIWLLYKLR